MPLLISDQILESVRLSDEELLIDIACYLYEKKKLGAGKARELSTLNHLDFQKALASRNIDLHYSEESLHQELNNLGIAF